MDSLDLCRIKYCEISGINVLDLQGAVPLRSERRFPLKCSDFDNIGDSCDSYGTISGIFHDSICLFVITCW